MLRLKQLKVKGVRGIVDGPDLHFGTSGLLLCGDNGTGKSSYIDAIEKVFTDKCSSLDIGVRGISWRKQGTHIESGNPEIELTLTDGFKDVILTPETDHTTLDKQSHIFLEAARRQSFILRRRKMLDFIDAVPRKRYQAIEAFLNFDEFTSFEAQLKELRKETQAKLAATNESRKQHERTLREQLKLDRDTTVNAETCVQAANDTLTIAQLTSLKSLDDLETSLAALETLLAPFKNMEALQKVQLLLDGIRQVPASTDLLSAAQEYAQARRKSTDEESRLKGHFYSQVLEKGLAWIKEDGLERCPLCNSSITLAEVTAYVNARLAENKKLIGLKQRQSETHAAFISVLKSQRDALKTVRERWQDTLDSDFPSEANQIITRENHLLESHAALLPLTEIKRDTAGLSAFRVLEVTQSLRETVEHKRDSFPDNTRYSQLYNAKIQLLAISVHFGEMASLDKRSIHLETCLAQLEIMINLAEESRKKAVQKLLNEIVKIADEYFQKIHPGEEIGKPQLLIPERGTGSIELTGRFHTQTGDPRGHYSEGHVDSLGLCLFLAIRRLHHAQCPNLALLILDDVMHSVDADHRRDTANLIFEEFKDHQIIITTHDPLWFEWLKQASRNSPGRFIKRRIASWTLATGPVWGDHLSNYEWLVSSEGQKAKPADKVIKAGLLLEEMLQNLCNDLYISVPFRIRGNYTIDPLWTSFYSTIKKKNKGFFVQAEACLKEIDQLRNLRNWVGAHWNEWAQTLTNSEAEAFTKAVLALRDYVYCTDCNQFIKRIAELDGVWSCKQEHKRYNK